jgi:hypothetical protein
MPRRKNHPKKRAGVSGHTGMTSSESESSAPASAVASPALGAAEASLADVPALSESLQNTVMEATPEGPVTTATPEAPPEAAAPAAVTIPATPEEPAAAPATPVAVPAPSLLRRILNWIPYFGSA